MWQWMQRDGTGREDVKYRLLAFTCSTHAANLVVRGAICGDESRSSGSRTDGHPLVATCVRYFKYLLPEYAVEFSIRLHTWVSETLVVRPHAPEEGNVQQWRGLQMLYGKEVLPDHLLALLNGAPGSLEHCSGGRSSGFSGSSADGRSSGSRESLVRAVSLAIERLCMRAEERPVTTRFWLFAGCVASLFTFVLLQMPPSTVLQTGIKNPRASFQRRIDRVCKYLENKDNRLQLAVACLCLRLTTVATAMTGQKK